MRLRLPVRIGSSLLLAKRKLCKRSGIADCRSVLRIEREDTTLQKNIFVVIPTLDEAQHIEQVLNALLHDRMIARMHICVVDGGSTDNTREIVARYRDRGVEFMFNGQRLQSAAVNLGARTARARGGFQYLVRIDAHAVYPPDFVSLLVAGARETDADSIVVPMLTLPGNSTQTTAALLFNSWLGHGGSAHRAGRNGGFVFHGHHALFKLAAFLDAGEYDPEFVANEDAEFDLRFVSHGFRIFMEMKARIGYVPRDTYSGIWTQMKRNGFYRVRTFYKHKRLPGARQLLPIFVGPVCVVSIILGSLLNVLFFGAFLFYVLLVFVAASWVKFESKEADWAYIYYVTAMAIVSHLAFSYGAFASLTVLAKNAIHLNAREH